ncbi:hypothetical protein N0V93_007105 [Gnomoniopsis smithogilvyi]|uniref:C3H1-type domain-containing protein n=1 Tax=Gnomoniopsis smithogilvyi TaxID=1191159 RepID=A0A9W8YPG3_9PEZI|nr:hypothetical protein N0V93_007105 [Gnomoniopsis smithogilvyi]
MLTDKEIDEASSQLTEYRQKDTLPNILNSYEALIENYRRLKSDYEEEREARERYKKQAKGQERNPFVLVLVDGDGYVFHDNFVSQGADGGSEAATLLNTRIKSSLAGKGLEHCEIMVRVYANVVGLSKALHKAGLANPEKRSLASFIANFNRSFPLTDFIDAGEYKENADFKLRGLLKLYAENAQCKHLYFAACHDAGYVSELTQYRNQSDRFTLIQTPGLYFHEEFRKLGLGIEELQGVFRPSGSAMDAVYPKPFQTPHNGSTKATPIMAASTPASKSQQTGKTESSGTLCPFYKSGKCRYGAYCRNIHLDPTSTTTINSGRLSQDWRSETGLSEHSGFGSSNYTKQRESAFVASIEPKQLPKKENIPDGHIPINESGHRLDTYITPVAFNAESRLKYRSAAQRLCNSMHLFGSCLNVNCEYDHSPLDEDLKPALEVLARSVPCPKRGTCRNARCTNGHVCQKPHCKYRGGKTFCKLGFPLHIDDMTAAQYVPAAVSRRPSNGTGEPGNEQSSPNLGTSTTQYDEDDDLEDDEGEGAAMYYEGSRMEDSPAPFSQQLATDNLL